MSDRKPISIEEIQALAAGEIIEIPGWVPGQKVDIRVRRIDVTPQLLALGKLPNMLRDAASSQFKKSTSEIAEKATEELTEDLELKELMPVIENVCRAAMIEPKFDEVQAVYPMLLDQKMAVFSYITAEVKALETFRPRLGGNVGDGSDSPSLGLSPE